MKKILSIIVISLVFSISLVAQTPQSFNYQAVARDNSGNILANKNIAIKISILDGSISGTTQYVETQNPQTNQFGLFTLEIGKGTVTSGTFANITWANGPKFVKIEMDVNNGTNFTLVGTSQLLSVPYALYSEKAGNGFSGNFNDLNNKPTLFSGSYIDLTNKPNLFSGKFSDLVGTPSLATSSTFGFMSSSDKIKLDGQINSQWSQNGNNLYYTNGNLGIGTNNPTAKLDINGSVKITAASSFISFDGAGALTPPTGITYGLFPYANVGLGLLSVHGGYSFWTGEGVTVPPYETMRIWRGKVGIGTDNPLSLLEVKGIIHSSTGGFKFPDGSIQTTASGSFTSGNGISITGSTITNTLPTQWITSGNNITYSSGNIGIGTNNPTEKLELNGNLLLSLNSYINLLGGDFTAPPVNCNYGLFPHINVGLGISSIHGGISFWTGEGVTVAPYESMRIWQGKVGIGTSDPKSKLSVKGGDVNILDIGSGIIMKSPNGQCWKVTIDNTGNFVKTSITCP